MTCSTCWATTAWWSGKLRGDGWRSALPIQPCTNCNETAFHTSFSKPKAKKGPLDNFTHISHTGPILDAVIMCARFHSTRYHSTPSGVYASRGQGCSDSKRRTNTVLDRWSLCLPDWCTLFVKPLCDLKAAFCMMKPNPMNALKFKLKAICLFKNT